MSQILEISVIEFLLKHFILVGLNKTNYECAHLDFTKIEQGRFLN